MVKKLHRDADLTDAEQPGGIAPVTVWDAVW